MPGETFTAEIRGQRFEVPIYVDEATTRACIEKVARYYAEAESEAPVVNTQVFALQTAYRLAAEAAERESAHAEEIARLTASHEQALAEAQQATRDLEHEMAEALEGLGHALRGLLDERSPTHGPPQGRGTGRS